MKTMNLRQKFSDFMAESRARGAAAVNAVHPGQMSISRLQTYAIAFVVIGVVLTVGLKVLGGVQDQINNSDAEAGATQAIEGLTTFTEWLPLIALVVVAAIIIALVSMFRNTSGRAGA